MMASLMQSASQVHLSIGLFVALERELVAISYCWNAGKLGQR